MGGFECGPPLNIFTTYHSHLLVPSVSHSTTLFYPVTSLLPSHVHNHAYLLHSPLCHVPFSSSLLSSNTFFILLQVTHPRDVFSPFVNHVPPRLLLSPVSPPPHSHISGPTSSVTCIFPTTFPLPHLSTWPLLISSPHQAVKSPLPSHCPFIACVMCSGHHVGSHISLLALS
jgi:hypothetical protein